ncbi:MAG: accessory gene regulator B family protein [Oscillospiraceae bacterium]|nr:accessory gene regulator B family protein [Oscillospiraceae bacterium]MCL2279734.1 accessory gene regulator B family protein [Oscillospiraceae bacterium]
MFTKNAARKTCDWLVRSGGIEDSKRVVYEFGLDKLYTSLANFAIASIIGFMFGVFLQTALFFGVYIALRVYAGGYHAKSPTICFFVSFLILIPFVIAIRYYHLWNTPIVFWTVLLISVVTLVLLGTVENQNKLLDSMEKKVYRRRLLRNLTVIVAIAVTLSILSQGSYAVAVLCGVMLTAITAGVGKMVFIKQQSVNSQES